MEATKKEMIAVLNQMVTSLQSELEANTQEKERVLSDMQDQLQKLEVSSDALRWGNGVKLCKEHEHHKNCFVTLTRVLLL